MSESYFLGLLDHGTLGDQVMQTSILEWAESFRVFVFRRSRDTNSKGLRDSWSYLLWLSENKWHKFSDSKRHRFKGPERFKLFFLGTLSKYRRSSDINLDIWKAWGFWSLVPWRINWTSDQTLKGLIELVSYFLELSVMMRCKFKGSEGSSSPYICMWRDI